MTIVMGVDGGGSKTYAVIVDEQGRKLGAGLAGSGNYQRVGLAEAMGNIRSAADQALSRAQLTAEQIDFVQYGLAGADRPHDFANLRPALADLPFSRWELVCDTMEGLRSGSPGYTGVVLICGSGTNAAGRNKAGDTVQVGGLGILFGDRAGGEYMSAATMQAAVRSWEGREKPSVLTELLPAFFGDASMEAMVDRLMEADISSVPEQLTVVLHEAAGKGDELAIDLLRQTGVELGEAANAVIRKLGGFKDELVPIVLIGSVLQKGRNSGLLEELRNTVKRANPAIKLSIPEMAPVYGAVMLALDHEGVAVGEAMEEMFTAYGGYQNETR